MVGKLLQADFSGVCVGFVISNVFGLQYIFPRITLFRLVLNSKSHYCPALQAGSFAKMRLSQKGQPLFLPVSCKILDFCIILSLHRKDYSNLLILLITI